MNEKRALFYQVMKAYWDHIDKFSDLGKYLVNEDEWSLLYPLESVLRAYFGFDIDDVTLDLWADCIEHERTDLEAVWEDKERHIHGME